MGILLGPLILPDLKGAQYLFTAQRGMQEVEQFACTFICLLCFFQLTNLNYHKIKPSSIHY